ncbi:MAG: Na(+)/H(+) antiporter subunit B [Gammaproteobacteria bacterium]|nr:Na(+)/H(+) antiporter subunit B [Gammaproteobacteria bacterium]
MEHHKVLRVVTRLLTPLILLFALYVQFHGDFGPGGGFQAGVIFGAGVILFAIVFGMQRCMRALPPSLMRIIAGGGVLLYAGVGVAGILLGGNYLEYNMLGAGAIAGQHLGINLIEVGVGATVAAMMVCLFYCFAGGEVDGESQGEGGADG